MSYAESVGTITDQITANTNLATFIAAGLKVRAIATRTGFVRVYPRGDEVPGGTAASANLPVLTNMVANSVAGKNGSTVYDDAAPWYSQGGDYTPGNIDQGSAFVGSYHITLTPAAGDTVNSSSPQIFTVEPTAILVLATG